MKTWFTSLNGALTLAALAWLSELWRAWLDMLFIYPGGSVHATIDSGSTLAVTLVYTAVFAGWAYALYLTAFSSRRALIVTCVLNVFVWLAIPIGWLAFYCTGSCAVNAGVMFNLANWLNLILGLLAGVGLVLQLGQKKVAG